MTSTTTSTTATKRGIRIKSRVRAGLDGIATNHNQAAKGVRVKSHAKVGGMSMQHNQTAKGLRVKSRVKAGEIVVTKAEDGNSGNSIFR